MGANEIIRLQDSEEKEIWQEACTALWIQVFGDKEEFVQYYMDSTWKRNQVFLLPCCEYGDLLGNVPCEPESFWQENGVASMLHMNPYPLRVREEIVYVHYIVGVCTREELRGRGYMDLLLREALGVLKEQSEPFTYLMPAAVGIYLPYQFVPVGFMEQKVYNALRQGHRTVASEIRIIPFKDLSERDRKQVIRRAESHRGDIHVPLTEDYLQELEMQVQTCDGELITLWQHDELIGIVAYLYEEGETPVEVMQFFSADGWDDRVRALFHQYICEHFQVEQIPIQYDDMYKMSISGYGDHADLRAADFCGKQCTTMIRCLDPEWFLKRLPPQDDWGWKSILAVTDDILEENNRTYQVIFDRKGSLNDVTVCQDMPEHCIHVGTLVEYVLNGLTIYTPEMV